ncbi:MAG: DUF1071 domain-containing protein [Corallococcus sp.]|nr:DUF1071 domain-containing protein [Corallococcus sp.]
MNTDEKMENNYFAALNKINVTEKTEKKNGLTYLSWAWAWGEVKKQYPEAQYHIYENEQGWNYFTDGKTCWVKTSVTVNGIEHIDYLPVMDFRNASIPKDKVTSFDVNKAIQRSITKACARHGLGLYIYAGEDLPEEPTPQHEEPPKQTSPAPTPQQQAPVNVSINDIVPPTEEQLRELVSLGGTIDVVADYNKVPPFMVTADMVQILIDRKKKILAGEGQK